MSFKTKLGLNRHTALTHGIYSTPSKYMRNHKGIKYNDNACKCTVLERVNGYKRCTNCGKIFLP